MLYWDFIFFLFYSNFEEIFKSHFKKTKQKTKKTLVDTLKWSLCKAKIIIKYTFTQRDSNI